MHSRRRNTQRRKSISSIVFGRDDDTPKQKDIRFFILSLMIGLVICVLFGCALFILNVQGRI